MTNRDAKRLDGVHPTVAAAYTKMNMAMSALGFPIFIVEGMRTVARQAELYAQGRTRPGRIVTYADGVTKKSNHQVGGDHYGHAIDIAFFDNLATPGDETWDPAMPWDLVGLMGQKLGLAWGGAWTTFKDYGHFELLI